MLITVNYYLQGRKRKKRANVTRPLDEPSTSLSLREDEESPLPSSIQEEVTAPEEMRTVSDLEQRTSRTSPGLVL